MKLSHVGIAVKNLNDASELFSKLFGIDKIPTEEVSEQKVKVGFCHLGESSIELTEATAPDSPIAKFIEKRGEGVHHLSFEVENIEEELKRLKDAGFQLIDEKPRIGAGGHLIAFLHPKSANGVLIELCQLVKE